MTEQAFFVLTVLADGPRHGYGLVGEVAELSHGQVRLKIGNLYGVLDRLAAEGLIEPDQEEARGGRLRRYYRLTENGRGALALGWPPSPRSDCRGAEEPARRHRPGGARDTAPDRKARGEMSGNLERRYRRVLRPLSGWFRRQWERHVVAAFLERLTGGPAAGQYVSQAAGHGRAETARVASPAARAYRGGFGAAPPRPAPGFCRPGRRLRAAVGLAAAGLLLVAVGCSSSSGPAGQSQSAGKVVSDCLTQARCYAPHQFRVAYGIQPLLDHGIDGRGQTVALVEFATPPGPPPQVTDIRQDLADFDSRFGLPAARIQVINSLARSASPWLATAEEVGDTEMVHAVAPDATIRELMVDMTTRAEFVAMYSKAVRTAAGDGDVIVLPHEYGENLFTNAGAAIINSALEYAAARHVTVVAGSGDGGAIATRRGSSAPVREVSLPASDPLVLAVGGTTLTANRVTGAYISETAWNDPQLKIPGTGGQSSASAGGFSHLFARPAYQDGVPGIGAWRGVPDVAGEAGTFTDMAFAFAAPGGGYALLHAGGTSASGPFWAGLIALADQKAGHPLGFVNPVIYRIARGPQYHKAFHDITTGNNTVVLNGVTITGYQAGPGWDPVTGWGTPDAQVLVPLLARYASPQIGPASQ
jgi:DNA-binding PadR family transcriptional regulator